MNKKTIKYGIMTILVAIIGIVSVNAATQTLFSMNNYSISSGQTTEANALTPNFGYRYAVADFTPSSIGSGTKKTVFIGSLKGLIGYEQKQKKTSNISTTACWTVKLGQIGSGEWQIKNQAKDGNTNYAGWSGSLTYSASTTS